MEIEINRKKYLAGAADVDGLPRPAILGRDVKDLVALALEEDQRMNTSVLGVMTRE